MRRLENYQALIHCLKKRIAGVLIKDLMQEYNLSKASAYRLLGREHLYNRSLMFFYGNTAVENIPRGIPKTTRSITIIGMLALLYNSLKNV